MTAGFKANDLDSVFERVNTVLSRIPHQLFTRYEGHYHSLIHLMFEYAGLKPESERSGSKGDNDMAIETKDSVYVFEFKTKDNKGINRAFKQIRDREYARRYEAGSKSIHHVAVELDTKKREVNYKLRTQVPRDSGRD